jgi:enterochelin esterase-like enzyme
MRQLHYYLLLLLAACSAVEQSPPPSILTVASGQVERLDSFPTQLVTPRHVDIWLPDSYDGQRPHQVLYMHDGQMLYDSTTTWNGQEWGVDETLGALIAQGDVPPTMVVGIWNGGPDRHADYFPQRPFEQLNSLFRDSLLTDYRRDPATKLFATEVQSDNYLRFIVEELKPYIDSNYATLSDHAHTFLVGSSMGGLISMYGICEYPEVFGAAACLSTHWPGIFRVHDNPIPAAFQAYLAANLPCRSGGIGRRAGFKIQFWQQSAGSIPAFGTRALAGRFKIQFWQQRACP